MQDQRQVTALISRFTIAVLCLSFITMPIAQAQESAPDEGTITISLKGTPLADAMNFFAGELGVGILVDASIEDIQVTARITNIPVMEAFEAILRANGLWYKVEDNEDGRVYLIKQTTITFTVEGTPLADVMEFFADELGVSILVDASVEDMQVSGRITKIPIMEAFGAILQANGLLYEVNETGRVYLVKGQP